MKVGRDIVKGFATPLVPRAQQPATAQHRPPRAAGQSQIVPDQPPYRAGNAF